MLVFEKVKECCALKCFKLETNEINYITGLPTKRLKNVKNTSTISLKLFLTK